jgi:hypothetical protein
VPLETDITQLRGFLSAERISKDNLPQALKQQWVAADGRARVDVAPKGNTDDTEVHGRSLVRFLPPFRTRPAVDFNS